MKKFLCISVFILSFMGSVGGVKVFAATAQESVCAGIGLAADGSGCAEPTTGGVSSVISTAIVVLSTIVGIVAVIMIVIGGFKYVTSQGDSGKITSAKNTVLYALIGLLIAALAQVLVHFVLNKFLNDTPPATETTLPRRP